MSPWPTAEVEGVSSVGFNWACWPSLRAQGGAHSFCPTQSRGIPRQNCNSVRGSFPQRRFCVETLRAPSFPLVTPSLGFPRYRAKGTACAAPENGKWSVQAQRAKPSTATKRPYGAAGGGLGNRQGAKRRAAGAVSGEAAVQSANQPIQLISKRSDGALPSSWKLPRRGMARDVLYL